LAATKCLTPIEITQWRKDGMCFHCNDFFSNGNKTICNQLFVIEVITEEGPELPTKSKVLMISLHAITGIHPRSGRTM
jgi:hypothetical protein